MQQFLTYTSPSIPGIDALSCLNDFVFENHIHNGHVIWLNSEGGEQCSIKGNSTILQPGSISVIEPGVVHANGPCEKSGRHLRSLYLEESFFLYLEQLLTGSSSGNFVLPTVSFSNRYLWQQLLVLHESIMQGADRLCIEERILFLFSEIEQLRFGKRKASSFTRYPTGKIGVILEYMHANMRQDVSLRSLANSVDCTSYHIIRIFREKVGMSPHAYLVQLRLEKARVLLDNGEHIADAAYQTGFSDQSHLTRRFKRRYGITPGVYISQKNLRSHS